MCQIFETRLGVGLADIKRQFPNLVGDSYMEGEGAGGDDLTEAQ